MAGMHFRFYRRIVEPIQKYLNFVMVYASKMLYTIATRVSLISQHRQQQPLDYTLYLFQQFQKSNL